MIFYISRPPYNISKSRINIKKCTNSFISCSPPLEESSKPIKTSLSSQAQQCRKEHHGATTALIRAEAIIPIKDGPCSSSTSNCGPAGIQGTVCPGRDEGLRSCLGVQVKPPVLGCKQPFPLLSPRPIFSLTTCAKAGRNISC